MAMKIAYAEIVDGHLILPAEALDVLPSSTRLFTVIDSERGIVSVHAKDPTNLGNQEFLQSLADLNEGLTLEDYTRPVSDSELRGRKPSDDGSKR